ncbi:cell polarity protein [Drepanopeziza brunnea f. sp. 'multigermtubi' MB_m1]|uniref:Cell polarity protein n=1 Tax=Marssonina brunnea f. sp. multigermtubi (strain MB_m1) TaxID=1072389 RepID=K1X076_MARBU|nr:cell polarity protein [Drepanopeziza brunnea f. sp. 'multigermtubi' MB_m1]EKD18377.1 cell polarity protein [Drepanopeziza brunnea f. sp. 'multigermtubi' MB_m1]
MNGRNGPMSPVSVGDSEWSGISKYQRNDKDSPYPPTTQRGQLASPPLSGGSTGAMNGGGYPPRGPPMGNGPGGAPSPPSSIARSSGGNGLYAQSESGRSRKDEQFESALSEHYVALRRYLAQSLRDEKVNPRPNRARDKLLRLSPVQFQELSTDVFDELLRRQQSGRRTPNGAAPVGGPPPYLLPKDIFHPKRNQARQKLSTLPPSRFRDLATDVFYELERRFPRFAGDNISRMDSPASSMRGPPSRNGNGTPVNGMPRMRRPSDATSVSGFSVRSDSRGGPRPMNGGMNGGLGVPHSPGMPPNDYSRPTPKQFQSNTIVPNKSTMVEDDETGGEDNDDDYPDAFGLEGAARTRDSKKSTGGSSDTDKKLIDDYQSQVAELREKLDSMEDSLKLKDDELNSVLDGERSRANVVEMEKQEFLVLKMNLESKLADAQNLNESLQSELDRMRAESANTERDLRAQIEEMRAAGAGSKGQQANTERELRAQIEELQAAVAASRGQHASNERELRAQIEELQAAGAVSKEMTDEDLERENEELRAELKGQQIVTDEVRREAQEFLREMRILSERSESSYDREEQLSNTVNKLEEEVKDWRNRYARTKTQLRSLRASSIGLTIQQDAARYAKENGFTEANGMVKDVHVTKFQISIDELLKTARVDDPARVMEFMKSVIVNVRRITQDIDEAPNSSEEMAQQQTKLKSRVSATANNLITASKNFAAAKGLSPVSLLDAAASHLTSAVVELVRTVKIRPTPAGELEDDDDGNLAPVDTTGFFPVRDVLQETTKSNNISAPFQGPGRVSMDSSMYSPVYSPLDSTLRMKSSGRESWAVRQRTMSRSSQNGNGFLNSASNAGSKPLPPAPLEAGFGITTTESNVEELKIYLEDQTALLVQSIQSLVSSIRSEGSIDAISVQINAIVDVVGTVVSSTETAMSSTGNGSLRNQAEPIVRKLAGIRERLIDAGKMGREIADDDRDDGEVETAWRAWNQSLPPIAFEIARETKELVMRVDNCDGGRNGDDDFS